MGWQNGATWAGGIAAIVGQFWGQSFYLSAIGGVLVILALLIK